jgi:hypothetical protein
MPITKGGSQKPIARVNGKVSAKIYRGRFRMAEHVRYLDLSALERVKKAVIEIGSVHAANVSVPLVAEVQKGMVVGLRPVHCRGCKPASRKSASRLEIQRTAKAALQKVRDLGLHSVQLPMSMARLRGGLFGITIWIIVDYEVCIVIEFDDGEICYYCTQTGSFCIGPPSP